MVDGWADNSIALRVEARMIPGYVPTPQEAAQWEREAAEHAAAHARAWAAPAPALTLESLLAELAWPVEFAEHLLHPACLCDPLDEDPSLCSRALADGWGLSWTSGPRRFGAAVVRRPS